MSRTRIKPGQLKAFMARAWGLPQQLQLAESAALARAGRYDEILRRADELFAAAQRLTPGWTNEEARREDFEAHVALAQKLARLEVNRRSRAER